MAEVDWDSRAKEGVAHQAVIDPGDKSGLKNALIDRIQWNQIHEWVGRRQSVLDFGCGVGRFAERIARTGALYRGTDASQEMIEVARRLHGDGPAVFERVDGPTLPFDAGSFDGCLTVYVLQYLKTSDGAQLHRTVAELARVLTTGGELLLIEQASASEGCSGSVSEAATEQDYRDALASHFDVAEVRRIRCGNLSRLSSLFIQHGERLPLRSSIEGLLARREASIAENLTPERLQLLTYYELCIVATKRGAP